METFRGDADVRSRPARASRYSTFVSKFGKDGSPNAYPYSEQSDQNSGLHGVQQGGVGVTLMAPEEIPVKHAIAQEFGVFNKLYTAVPSASSPNHLFTQSGTSCGMTANALYDDCGGPNATFPQDTIYDNLRRHGVDFGLFMNSTCGLDGSPCHGEAQDDPDSASAISTPDVAMEGVRAPGRNQRPVASRRLLRAPRTIRVVAAA